MVFLVLWKSIFKNIIDLFGVKVFLKKKKTTGNNLKTNYNNERKETTISKS
jgi:hypothetical protein